MASYYESKDLAKFGDSGKNRKQLWDFDKLMSGQIIFGSHCSGCTVGAGSSCGGADVLGE